MSAFGDLNFVACTVEALAARPPALPFVAMPGAGGGAGTGEMRLEGLYRVVIRNRVIVDMYSHDIL